jgi:hypothetical protein
VVQRTSTSATSTCDTAALVRSTWCGTTHQAAARGTASFACETVARLLHMSVYRAHHTTDDGTRKYIRKRSFWVLRNRPTSLHQVLVEVSVLFYRQNPAIVQLYRLCCRACAAYRHCRPLVMRPRRWRPACKVISVCSFPRQRSHSVTTVVEWRHLPCFTCEAHSRA